MSKRFPLAFSAPSAGVAVSAPGVGFETQKRLADLGSAVVELVAGFAGAAKPPPPNILGLGSLDSSLPLEPPASEPPNIPPPVDFDVSPKLTPDLAKSEPVVD